MSACVLGLLDVKLYEELINIKNYNIEFNFSVCSVQELLEILERAGKLSSDVVRQVHEFISANNTYSTGPEDKAPPQKKVHSNHINFFVIIGNY